MLKSARNKGKNFELYLVKKFKELGQNCTTSRFSSKEQDDLGVDLCNVRGLNVQAKAVERLGPLHPILSRMPKNNINVVFHKMNRQGTIVAMSEEDFMEIYKHLLANGYFND
jgi:hypothetical protein